MDEISSPQTPEGWLQMIREDRTLTSRDRERSFKRLIELHSPVQLVAAASLRVGDLSGDDAEFVLRIFEAYGDVNDIQSLVRSLSAQPDLSPEVAWTALSILDGIGALEDEPELSARWDELNDELGEEGSSLETLAQQLEEEPDGSWVALQGLGAVEPEIRAEIIAGLAELPGGPGLVAFLRILTFAHDPATRWAALDALEARPVSDLGVNEAWTSIAASHPDPGIVARAEEKTAAAPVPLQPGDEPQLLRSLITAVDGEGRATIVLASREGDRWAGAAFLCHVVHGVIEVVGQDGLGHAGLDEAFESLREGAISEVVEGNTELARSLLSGSLFLCGSTAPPSLRYWIERTAGPRFRGGEPVQLFEDWDPSTITPDVDSVLEACPSWADTSDLAQDLATEVRVRGVGSLPDPKRDAGAYRYLFEHRHLDRIELYQRMLFWMAAVWKAKGQAERARSALALAWQLADPQHAVPSHPFFVALTTLSLTATTSIIE